MTEEAFPDQTSEPPAVNDTEPSDDSDSTITESDSATESQPRDPPASACTHIPTAILAVAPTCTQTGYGEGSVCGDCGTLLTTPR